MLDYGESCFSKDFICKGINLWPVDFLWWKRLVVGVVSRHVLFVPDMNLFDEHMRGLFYDFSADTATSNDMKRDFSKHTCIKDTFLSFWCEMFVHNTILFLFNKRPILEPQLHESKTISASVKRLHVVGKDSD